MNEITDQEASSELTPARAAELQRRGEAQIVDVRERSEWEAGRISGAIHIPLESLPARAAELDSELLVVFQCRTGARSGMATAAFRASGIEAFNLSGGLEAWVADGLPIEPSEGAVASARPDNS